MTFPRYFLLFFLIKGSLACNGKDVNHIVDVLLEVADWKYLAHQLDINPGNIEETCRTNAASCYRRELVTTYCDSTGLAVEDVAENIAEALGQRNKRQANNLRAKFPRTCPGNSATCEGPEADTPDPIQNSPQPLGPPGTTLADSPGLAILVTCDYEGTYRPLLGTNVDAEEMKKTFQFLNYVIYRLQNEAATKANIQALLKEVSNDLQIYDKTNTENKVIAFAFSGHGTSRDKRMKIVTNDGKELDIEDEIVLPLTRHKAVREIPKLFFLDACRGSERLRNKKEGGAILVPKGDFKLELTEKGIATSSGNYRIDYATIPGHVSYADDREGSMWMPVMARALRERNDTVQNIAADVRGAVFEKLSALGESTTQCGETQGRLFRSLKLVK